MAHLLATIAFACAAYSANSLHSPLVHYNHFAYLLYLQACTVCNAHPPCSLPCGMIEINEYMFTLKTRLKVTIAFVVVTGNTHILKMLLYRGSFFSPMGVHFKSGSHLFFLNACMQLYNPLCQLVGWLVIL